MTDPKKPADPAPAPEKVAAPCPQCGATEVMEYSVKQGRVGRFCAGCETELTA